jgi:hypothetical protein
MEKIKAAGEFENLFEAFKHVEGQEEMLLEVAVDFTREEFKGSLNGDPASLLYVEMFNAVREIQEEDYAIVLPGKFNFEVYDVGDKMRAVGFLQVNIQYLKFMADEDDGDLETAA